MVEFLVGPRWFYGIDTLFDAISIIVSFLVAVFAYKVYKFTSQKKYLSFSIAFLLVSIALSFKIISNFVVFYKTVERTFYGLFTVTYTHSFDFINKAALFLSRLLTLTGFIIILTNILKIKDRKIIFLLLFFSFISTLFSSYVYFVFHLILALVLGFISYHYFRVSKSLKNKSSKLVMLSFLGMFISQLMFIFFIIDNSFYVFGELFQLLGFLFLLSAYINILRK